MQIIAYIFTNFRFFFAGACVYEIFFVILRDIFDVYAEK